MGDTFLFFVQLAASISADKMENVTKKPFPCKFDGEKLKYMCYDYCDRFKCIFYFFDKGGSGDAYGAYRR